MNYGEIKNKLSGQYAESSLIYMMKNSSFLLFELLDEDMKQLSVDNLRQNLTVNFKLSLQDILFLENRYTHFFCAGRENFRQDWNWESVYVKAFD